MGTQIERDATINEAHTMSITLYEKIATIVYSYLHNGTEGGTFGTVARFDAHEPTGAPAGYRVVCEGKTYIVRNTRIGWSVQFCGLIAEDADLENAARLLLAEIRLGNPALSVSSVNRALGIA